MSANDVTSDIIIDDAHLTRTFHGGLIRVWDVQQSKSSACSLVGLATILVQHVNNFIRHIFHLHTWRDKLQLSLFLEPTLYHAALAEFVGTFILTFMILVISTSILVHTSDYSFFPTASAIVQLPLIAFMILSTGPTSGGHLNPMVSFSTFVAGLTEFPRMIVYIATQIVAAIAASYTAKYMLPPSIVDATKLAMCSLGTEQTVQQALTIEIFCCFFVLFGAFGTALDDRQRQVFKPGTAPFIIATLIAMLIYCTATMSSGGTGAVTFPTRCLGPAIAMGLVTSESFTLGSGRVVHNAQWIYWIGPMISSFMVGVLYRVVPPSYLIRVAEKRQLQQELYARNHNTIMKVKEM